METGNITEVHLITPNGNQVIYSYNEHGQMLGSKSSGKDRIKKMTEQERLEKALLKRSEDCLTYNENYL
jgi:YD repeat-containing protein